MNAAFQAYVVKVAHSARDANEILELMVNDGYQLVSGCASEIPDAVGPGIRSLTFVMYFGHV